jgi:hypothetical protein
MKRTSCLRNLSSLLAKNEISIEKSSENYSVGEWTCSPTSYIINIRSAGNDPGLMYLPYFTAGALRNADFQPQCRKQWGSLPFFHIQQISTQSHRTTASSGAMWYHGGLLRVLRNRPGGDEIWNTTFFHLLRAEN